MRSLRSLTILFLCTFLSIFSVVWLLFSFSNKQGLNGNFLKSHLFSLFGVFIVPADQDTFISESTNETTSFVDVSYL